MVYSACLSPYGFLDRLVLVADRDPSPRKSLDGLPRADYDHLSGDIKRAFSQVLAEWLLYMKHLKADYPYLFSLAVRMNPINPDADPVVKE